MDIFAFFVSFAFLNVIFAGISTRVSNYQIRQVDV